MRISRVFTRERSVFKKWKEDNEEMLEEVFSYDVSHSKIHRIVRDPTDVNYIFNLSFNLIIL